MYNQTNSISVWCHEGSPKIDLASFNYIWQNTMRNPITSENGVDNLLHEKKAS